jgi:hypothetical protein
MAKTHDNITPELQTFIRSQHLFFVATAPLSTDGHINLSPKGHDVLRILSDRQVAYLDLTGSGNETSAHLLENGRITLMFCAFEGPPNIVRLYGTGRVVLPDTPEWDVLSPQFTPLLGMRQIMVVDVERVQSSCGYAVPFFDYVGERETLQKYWDHKGEDGKVAYQQEKNRESIDCLPTHLAERSTATASE